MIFNMTGGGAPLNFKVVGGTTQPSNPTENTIWVNTSTAISNWIFSATQPTSPQSGCVWFTVGSVSQIAFNSLKKNMIMVYPMSAMQYSGISWAKVTAKIYQNNTWKPFSQIIIPNTSVTWTQSSSNASIDSIKATNNEASTVVEIKHRSSNGSAGTAYMISSGFECAAYSTLHIEGILSWDNSGSTNNTIQRIRLYSAGTNTEIGIAYTNSTEGTSSGSVNISVDYDISSVSDFCLVFESNTWDMTKYITCTFEITNSYLN